MLRFILIILLYATLQACSSAPDNTASLHDYDNAPEVYVDGGTLYYVAGISEENNKKAFELAETNELTALYIDSPGGDVVKGIELARLVMDNELDVHVGPFCASSCANYILAAGKQVYLQPDSVLVWHGSSYQLGASQILKKDPESQMKAWRLAEQQFFIEVQISPFVTVCGFDSASMLDNWLHAIGIAPIAGFSYSLDQLKAFGFNNIIAPAESWNPPGSVYGDKIFQGEYCESVSWDLGES